MTTQREEDLLEALTELSNIVEHCLSELDKSRFRATLAAASDLIKTETERQSDNTAPWR